MTPEGIRLALGYQRRSRSRMSNLETFARDELQRAGLPEPMECPECIRYEREKRRAARSRKEGQDNG